MPRIFVTSQRAFPVALVLTLALGLAPGGGFGLTKVLAEVVKFVLLPFGVPFNALAAVIRPATANKPPDARQRHFEEEVAKFEQMYLAALARVEGLERELDQLQKIQTEHLKIPVHLLSARVALRAPTNPRGLVTLNRGTSHGVKPGTVAVYESVHLLGRVTENISAVNCTLLPLTNPENKLINAVVIAKDLDVDPESFAKAFAKAPRIQLTPRGDGAFSADADKLLLINPGDVVRLDDEGWPASAQQMIIGHVESAQTKESEPLRNEVVVRPVFQVVQVDSVVLKIEVDEAPAVGNGP